MNPEEIKQGRQEIIERFGPWTAHTVRLAEDVYTIEESDPERDHRITLNSLHLRRIVQAVSDAAARPLKDLRILDLGSLEGMYALEFARQGAEVVAIEGRQASIDKSQFAQKVLGLDNVQFVQDDVRNLSVEKYGHFDAVLCIGILYHLNAPDVFHFAERVAEVCRRVAIFDTHYSHTSETEWAFKDHLYYGKQFTEFPTGATAEEKEKSAWASLDNLQSFWFTLPSLFNLFADIGFTSAYTCFNPSLGGRWPDRDTFVAVKGETQPLFTNPVVNERWPEELALDTVRPPAAVRRNIVRGAARRLRNLSRRIVPGRRA